MNDSANLAQTAVRFALNAPLSGPLVPLERVPDPVFAQKMVGDGISIDPIDQCLRAPCDGEIAQLHPAGHAVTIATPQGIEVMIHIGLDTVGLKGASSPRRRSRADRRYPDRIDADYIATRAVLPANPDCHYQQRKVTPALSAIVTAVRT
ncbi:MAG: PTS glucose transporter subunit IIA [Candidatus Competibacteraceae bacterium]